MGTKRRRYRAHSFRVSNEELTLQQGKKHDIYMRKLNEKEQQQQNNKQLLRNKQYVQYNPSTMEKTKEKSHMK